MHNKTTHVHAVLCVKAMGWIPKKQFDIQIIWNKAYTRQIVQDFSQLGGTKYTHILFGHDNSWHHYTYVGQIMQWRHKLHHHHTPAAPAPPPPSSAARTKEKRKCSDIHMEQISFLRCHYKTFVTFQQKSNFCILRRNNTNLRMQTF